MNETNLTRTIQLAIGKLAFLKVFRNNVGTGWVGQLLSIKNGDAIIKNARPLHAGLCQGSSDLIGWRSRVITPEMVGQRVAVFTAIEIKTSTGRVSEAQQNFLHEVHTAGGIAIVAKSVDDVMSGIK